MEHKERENDFSWNVNKSISNKDENSVTPIVLEPTKYSTKINSLNSDAKAEMEELFDEFKHKISDIILRETNKK